MSLANYEQTATDFGNPNWVAYQTIVRTEIRRFSRIWVQTMIPPAITMTLFYNFREPDWPTDWRDGRF